MHNTHNTGECLKYEKDRTPIKPLQGRSHSAICATDMRLASITLATCKCPRRYRSLKNLIRHSSTQTKITIAIVTARAMTPTHPEVMGLVAQGKLVINCTKRNKTNKSVNTSYKAIDDLGLTVNSN